MDRSRGTVRIRIIFLLALAAHQSLAATRTWTGSGAAPKLFTDPANWDSGVPTSSDLAYITKPDTVVFNSNITSGDVSVSSSGTFTATESAPGWIWSLLGSGGFKSGSGTFILNGLDLWTPGTIVSDNGTFIVGAGSEVRSSQTVNTSQGPAGAGTAGMLGTYVIRTGGMLSAPFLVLGQDYFTGPYSNGRMIVDGGVATFTSGVLLADVPYHASNATLTLSNGGIVNQNAGSLSIAHGDGVGAVATLSVSGANSRYNFTSANDVVVGSDNGTGQLSVTNSGVFHTNSTDAVVIYAHGSAFVDSGGALQAGDILVEGGTLSLGGGGGEISVNPGHSIRVILGGNFISSSFYSVTGGSTLSITNGAGTFAGLNVGANNAASLSVGTTGLVTTNGAGVWGTGSLGNAIVTVNGTENLNNGIFIGTNGGAASVTINTGTVNVGGTTGLYIGDSVGTAPATLAVNGATSALLMANFTPVLLNQRATLQLTNGGSFSTSSLTIDGGTFDGTGGTYSISAISGFTASLVVKNSGLLKGTDLTMGLSSIQLMTNGQINLSGTFVQNRGTINIANVDSTLKAGTASFIRDAAAVNSGGEISVGTLLLPFNPFGSATLAVSTGGAADVGTLLDIGSGNGLLLGGGSVQSKGNLNNAGSISLSSGSLSVGGLTTNNGSIVFSAASVASATLADLDGTGTVSATGGSGSMTFNHLRQTSVNIAGSTKLITNTNGGPAGVSRVNFLSLANPPSASWNLNDNDLIVDYPLGNPSPLAYVRSLIRFGFNGGSWNGPGLSSAVAAADHRKALGFAEASALGITSFSGQTVDATSVLVKFTYAGDANLDGQVDVTDLGALATHWQTNSDWTGGDFNYDGFVDVTDLGALATNWQQGVGSPLAPSRFDEALAAVGLGATSVPEPTALVALTMLLVSAPANARRAGRVARSCCKNEPTRAAAPRA